LEVSSSHEPNTATRIDADLKMTRARVALIVKHPFFASLALRMPFKVDPACQTAWTNGRVMAFNPDYVNTLAPDQTEGLVAHLVMHPACGHHLRRQGRDRNDWNRACDYVINGILLDAGLRLPAGYLFLEQYRGGSAEAVYQILRGEEGEEEDDSSGEEEAARLDEEEPGEGEHDQGEGEGLGDGETDEDEAGSSDPGLSGEVRDDPGEQGPGESLPPEIDWQRAMIQAGLNARDAGRLPAGLERLVTDAVAPRLGWRELLQRFILRSARSDYSWLRPNRRHLHHNLYLPSLSNHQLGEIVIAVDTSGSIDDGQLQRFAAEAGTVLEQCPATVHLLYCDLNIVRRELFQPHDPPILLKPTGGGGTDYRPVFTLIEQTGIQPDCLIYLTDLECDLFPERPPGYPVLWLHIGDDGVQPPFGEVVRLPTFEPVSPLP
jgi:predicted metal-dependent peptidase